MVRGSVTITKIGLISVLTTPSTKAAIIADMAPEKYISESNQSAISRAAEFINKEITHDILFTCLFEQL